MATPLKFTVLTLLCLFPFFLLAQSEDEVFVIVEEMPRFSGCEEMEGTSDEKKACAEKKMLKFIYQNISYPEGARINGTEGMVVLSFVIDELEKCKILKCLERWEMVVVRKRCAWSILCLIGFQESKTVRQ